MITIELVMSIVGLCIALGSFYFSRKGSTVESVSKLENRLATLEANAFTQEDRTCLNELELKMNLFWGIVQQEFPRLLIRAKTPALDTLLSKVSKGGSLSLTNSEHSDLLRRLNVEYINAIEAEDSGRAMAISLFRATLMFNRRARKRR